ncbi:venom protein L precursor [Nasonia vitripennis]|uniref:Uncharacterized protein n=1 Tax=Nasonia vitripennis TaxID=7425 RepID=A0A7M6UCX4_NASVI|nr:venom protein L precursor [Nasonia vitripennis]
MLKLKVFLVVGFVVLLGVSAKAQDIEDDDHENEIPITIIEGFKHSIEEQVQKNHLNCKNHAKYCKEQNKGGTVCLLIMKSFLCDNKTSDEQIKALIEELYAKSKVEYDQQHEHGSAA